MIAHEILFIRVDEQLPRTVETFVTLKSDSTGNWAYANVKSDVNPLTIMNKTDLELEYT